MNIFQRLTQARKDKPSKRWLKKVKRGDIDTIPQEVRTRNKTDAELSAQVQMVIHQGWNATHPHKRRTTNPKKLKRELRYRLKHGRASGNVRLHQYQTTEA